MATLEDIARKAIETTEKTQMDLLSKVKKSVKKAEKKIEKTEKTNDKKVGMRTLSTESKKSCMPAITARRVVDEDDHLTKTFIGSISHLQLTEQENDKVAIAFDAFKSTLNYNGIVMKCPGERDKNPCPHMEICPFKEIGRFPEGKLCPLEKLIADREMAEYLNMLKATPNDLPLAIFNMLFGLIECDLSEIRMRSKIHAEGYIVKKSVFVMSGKDGQIIEQDDISKAFEIKERVERRKEHILKSLMFTPEIRKKYDVAEDDHKDMSPADAIILAKQALTAPDDKPNK